MSPQGHCTQKDCNPTELGCERGHARFEDCEHWQATESAKDAAPVQEEGPLESFLGVRWTGRAMGLADLRSIAARGQLTVIGVVGLADAGKTSFLTALYLLLLRGHTLGTYRFAGSWTLEAWESLAFYTRPTADRPPTFPPHTSASGERIPGMLHLALRDARGRLRDVVWTDAPGEWFGDWALERNAASAEGARWVVRHADAFLLFADCERLAGPKRGVARQGLEGVMHRLGEELVQRPVSFLWSKADVELRPEMRKTLDRARERFLPTANALPISVYDESIRDNILRVNTELLERISSAGPLQLPEVEVVRQEDPFLSFRGRP